jgi:hypothetical protein
MMTLALALLPFATAAPPEAPDLEGTWALHMVVTTANDLPIVGALKSHSNTYVRTRLHRSADGWVQDHTVCGANVGGGLVRTRIPPSYTARVPTKTYPVQLLSREETFAYRADIGVFGVGWDPRCTYVPTEAGDPCEVDFESDGNPGATIEVKVPMFEWAEVYVAQRNHLKLDGNVVSNERIEGDIEILEIVNHVLGASKSMFARSPKSAPVAGESHFVMTRLAEDADCEAVLAVPKK